MKIMTVEEILACKIPEGDYFNCLNELVSIAKRSIEQDTFGSIDEFRLVFSNLYALAKGEYVEKKAVMNILYDFTYGVGGHKWTVMNVKALPTIGTEVL
jgi:hypothetical protein